MEIVNNCIQCIQDLHCLYSISSLHAQLQNLSDESLHESSPPTPPEITDPELKDPSYATVGIATGKYTYNITTNTSYDTVVLHNMTPNACYDTAVNVVTT